MGLITSPTRVPEMVVLQLGCEDRRVLQAVPHLGHDIHSRPPVLRLSVAGQ